MTTQRGSGWRSLKFVFERPPGSAPVQTRRGLRIIRLLNRHDETIQHGRRVERAIAMVGSSVLHYRITGKLGAGGMGIVWRAVDTRLGREVALKFLPDSATADPFRLERLEREAKAASALNLPNIVTIYEINADGDRHFIAMELIQGRPLSE